MQTPAKKLAGLIVLFLFSHFSNVYSQATNLHIFQEWVDKNGLSGAPDIVKKIKSKSGNFLYTLTSTVNPSGNYDWLLNKYNNTGALIWSSQYDGAAGTNDYALDIFIYSNRLFVTGTVTVDTAQGYDLGVAEFNDTTGALEWISTYDNGQSYPYYNDGGIGITIDIDQSNLFGIPYMFVTGGTQDPGRLTDYLTQCYDLSGNLQWTQTYDDNSLDDISADVTFNGYSVVVTGIVQKGPFNNAGLAIEYDISGNFVSSTQPSPAYDDTITQVHDIAFYPNGDIYIVGQLYNPSSGKNTKIVKLDNTLNVQWEYTSSLTGDDEGNFIMLDSSGHVYAGGYLTAGGNKDYMLMKFDTAGNLIWGPITYDGPANGEDVAEAGVLDYNGEILITGYSEIDSLNLDYYTMKYDTAGNFIWGINYNGLANKSDKASEIALDNSGNIYVIGQSQDSSGVNSQYITVKYLEHELFNVPDADTIPSSFDVIPNLGQLLSADTITYVNSTVKYYSNVPTLFFENTKLIHLFGCPDTSIATIDTLVRVDMIFTSDSSRRVFAQNKKTFYNNFYYPHTEETKGLVNVPNYDKIVYPEIYKKIDLHVSTNINGLKEQFVLKQGSDPKDIAFLFAGADTVYIDNNDLVIATILDTIRYLRPEASQIDSSGNYVTLGWDPYFIMSNDTVFFDSIQSFNSNLPLVIEMNQGTGQYSRSIENIEWSTYFGAGGHDEIIDAKSDINNFFYTTGYATSLFIPVFNGLYMNYGFGESDAIIAKFNPDGTRNWVTHFGGSNEENGLGIVTDGGGNVYVCGRSNSSNLPSGSIVPFQNSYSNNDDGFVVKFKYDGQQIFWRTYYGGTSSESLNSINIDSQGNILSVGFSGSSGLSITSTSAWEQSYAGGFDGIIVKFNLNGTRQWGTFFGGSNSSGNVDYLSDLDLDQYDNLYVTGYSLSSDFPQPVSQPAGAYVDNTLSGQFDVIIAKFNNSSDLVWSTLYGGSGSQSEKGNTIAVSRFGSIYVGGYTASSDFSTYAPGSEYIQTYGGGINDGFLLKFNSSLARVWATFYGGSEVDVVRDIHCKEQHIYVTGNTASTNLPLPIINPPNTYESLTFDGYSDPFLISFNSFLQPNWGTYIPGIRNDAGYCVITDLDNNLYLFGRVQSFEGENFPLDDGGGVPYWQPNHGSTLGYYDGFIMRFDLTTTLVGIENAPEDNDNFVVYPNPTSNLLYIYIKNGFESLSVINALGEIVYSSNNPNEGEIEEQLDLSGLTSGLYLIRLVSGAKVLTKKIIVTH